MIFTILSAMKRLMLEKAETCRNMPLRPCLVWPLAKLNELIAVMPETCRNVLPKHCLVWPWGNFDEMKAAVVFPMD